MLLLGIFVFMDLMMIFYVGWQCLPIYPVIFVLIFYGSHGVKIFLLPGERVPYDC